MIKRTFNIEFITPCYCSGANQKESELRAASIRGKLRWWFRLLGGSPDQEAKVFGSVDKESGSSSSINIRVEEKRSGDHIIREIDKTLNRYLIHFLNPNKRNSPIPPGKQFNIHIVQTRKVDIKIQELLDKSLECFFMIGTVGARGTRGLGSFFCNNYRTDLDSVFTFSKKIESWVRGIKIFITQTDLRQNQVLLNIEERLKSYRSNFSGRRKSALGFVLNNDRQTSLVYFRPLKCGENQFRILIFEAPHEMLSKERFPSVVDQVYR